MISSEALAAIPLSARCGCCRGFCPTLFQRGDGWLSGECSLKSPPKDFIAIIEVDGPNGAEQISLGGHAAWPRTNAISICERQSLDPRHLPHGGQHQLP